MRALLANAYSRECPHCHSVLELSVDRMNFNGVTWVDCPLCDMPVKFTDDKGFLLPYVDVVHDAFYEEYNDDNDKKYSPQLLNERLREMGIGIGDKRLGPKEKIRVYMRQSDTKELLFGVSQKGT